MKKIYLLQLLTLCSFAFNSNAMDNKSLSTEIGSLVKVIEEQRKKHLKNHIDESMNPGVREYYSKFWLALGRIKEKKEIDESRKQESASSSAAAEPINLDDLLLLDKSTDVEKK